jgi:hypothetical protein
MYIKGMVQVLGTTYRITRIQTGNYQVTRISDEAVAGSFSCGRTLEVVPFALDVALLRVIAAAAVQRGKTSWMGPALSV